jgi:hypothetical protein
MSTTLTHLAMKIKGMLTPKDIWNAIEDNAMLESTLYLLDAKDQLLSMKLADNNNPKTHLSKLKAHFQMMLQRRDNLMKIGLTLSDM